MTLIGLVNSPKLANMLAQKIINLKNQEFVAALQEAGISNRQILFRHILWNNSRRLLLVQFTHAFAGAIMLAISFSFIGVSTSMGNRSGLEFMVSEGWKNFEQVIGICFFSWGDFLNSVGGLSLAGWHQSPI